MRFLAIALLSLFFSGCSTIPLTQKATLIKDADMRDNKEFPGIAEKLMKDCRSLGSVRGNCQSRISPKQNADSSKNEALNRAADLGASHVMWQSIGWAPYVGWWAEGNAYDCNKSPDGSSKNKEGLNSKLAMIKKAFDDGIITEEEYKAKRKQIIQEY